MFLLSSRIGECFIVTAVLNLKTHYMYDCMTHKLYVVVERSDLLKCSTKVVNPFPCAAAAVQRYDSTLLPFPKKTIRLINY